jgi:hypothetical protein
VHDRRRTTRRGGRRNDISSVLKRVDQFDAYFKANSTVPINGHVTTGPKLPGADE